MFRIHFYLAVVVLGTSACRLGYESSTFELEIASDCKPDTLLNQDYTCTASLHEQTAPNRASWSLGPNTTCEWLTIDGSTGELSGRPLTITDIGSCVLDLIVQQETGEATSAIIPIEVRMAEQIALGAWHTCYLSTEGQVRCWGMNSFGALGYNDEITVGDGTSGRSIVEMGDVPVGGIVRQLSLANRQSCALLDNGAVRCWGLNNPPPRLGYDHDLNIGAGGPGGSIIQNGDVPVGGKAIQVATSGVGGCVLLEGGSVRCWGIVHGYNHSQAVAGTGPGGIADHGDVPIGEPVSQLAAGFSHYCALLKSGNVRCWGWNFDGQLGYNDTQEVGDETPGRSIMEMGNVPIGEKVVQISAGNATTCALLDNKQIRCWGWNGYGQLGYNDTITVGDGTPGRSILDMGDVPVGGDVAMISAGEEQACAVLVSGSVRCWGLNLGGQLGYNDNLPVGDGSIGRSIIDMGDVPVGEQVVSIQTTSWDTSHTCAILTNGAVRCWGHGSSGELGYNNTLDVGVGGAGGTIMEAGDVPIF